MRVQFTKAIIIGDIKEGDLVIICGVCIYLVGYSGRNSSKWSNSLNWIWSQKKIY